MTRKNKKENAGSPGLIVVLGMHRSGTSTITRGLQTLGVNLGNNLMPPMLNVNPKGFWEDLDIVRLNEAMPKEIDLTWHSLKPIEEKDVKKLCDGDYLEKARNILKDKVSGYAKFGFKDPRTAKLMSFWIHAFKNIEFDVNIF